MVDNKQTAFRLFLIGLIYFVLFACVNTAGAENVDMLAVFEIDEYAQFPHLLPMVAGGESIKYTLRNFLVYGHYFYGYPFYFFSGLVLLPFQWFFGDGLTIHMRWIMLALRQLLNVLPGMLSAYALTFFATRFRSFWKSTLVFLLMLLMPALVRNGFWWHPDGLGLLFVSLTMLFLSLDDWRYTHFFFLAAFTSGVAAGIKYLGLFFVLTIPMYLIWGVFRRQISGKKAALKALLFLLVMGVTFVLTNPLLLLPVERAELIAAQRTQFTRTLVGEVSGRQPFLEGGRLPGWLTENYGNLSFLLLIGAALVIAWRQRTQRLEAMIVTSYILSLGMVIAVMSLRRTHYLLPIFLPLTASLGFLLPDSWLRFTDWLKRSFLAWLVLGILIFQVVNFAVMDVALFEEMAERESRSASLAFYRNIQREVFADRSDQPLVIYRDWHVYFPADAHTTVFMDWDLADYGLVGEREPDYLLLEKANVETYGEEDFLASAADPERQAGMHRFYADALTGQIENYELEYADRFGMVFKRADVELKDL